MGSRVSRHAKPVYLLRKKRAVVQILSRHISGVSKVIYGEWGEKFHDHAKDFRFFVTFGARKNRERALAGKVCYT